MELILVEKNVNNGRYSTGNHGGPEISLFVDSETGVEYFVMNVTGNSTICPRLNVDGKPVVRK